MAYFSGSIRSRSLGGGMDTGLTVVLPFDRLTVGETECPVVYLLHGLGQDTGAWARMSSAERYANEYGVSLVMPQVQRSFYTDMEMGLAYYTYVAEELPEVCAKMFHLSPRREDTFVAGLSMGGYGALKVGLRHPRRFAGCAGFSGCLDMASLRDSLSTTEQGMAGEAKAIFGTELIIKPEDDLFHLVKETARLPREERPKVMVACGTEDYLYDHSVRFRNAIEPLGYDFLYKEWPGAHEWSFWDQAIQYALEYFFPGRKEALIQANG